MEQNILTNENTLEYYKTIENFPVSMACIPNRNNNEDKTMNMNFWICNKTGIIQIKPVPPLSDIYIDAHNTSYGAVWNNLFDLFVNELEQFMINDNINILEIGGGSLLLASKMLKVYNGNITKYTVFEKNISTQHTNDKRIEIVPEYFTPETDITSLHSTDFVIHSHVIEHVWNPTEFIKLIRNMFNVIDNRYHCFIAPNLQSTFARKYTNALNFEHNFYITEPFIDTILNNNGFEICSKKYYLDHSIIYITQPLVYSINNIVPFPNLYNVYKTHLDEFFKYHISLVHRINKAIKHTYLPIYLYGAHIFSQFLIGFGLHTNKIKCILDNSPQKQQKRLYGTTLFVEAPTVITNDIEGCIVILKAASYQEEIKTQLLKLNNKAIIIE